MIGFLTEMLQFSNKKVAPLLIQPNFKFAVGCKIDADSRAHDISRWRSTRAILAQCSKVSQFELGPCWIEVVPEPDSNIRQIPITAGPTPSLLHTGAVS